MAAFEDLEGKALSSIEIEDANDVVIFTCQDGTVYRMYHDQNCCEGVYLDDVCGNLDDLIGSPILQAEEVSYKNIDPDEAEHRPIEWDRYRNSWTWTFYKISTVKGSVTLRWYGESNGWYSESVSFVRDNEEADW